MTNDNSNLIPVCLDAFGFDSRYVLYPQGYVFDTKKGEKAKQYSHGKYSLRRLDGSFASVSLRTLYKDCYNKKYVVDEIDNLPNERWLTLVVDRPANTDITDYLVSDMGRIKSYKYYNSAILKPEIDKDGYEIIKVGGTKFRVNRLVALAFVPNDDKTKDTVHHINGIKNDNRAINLRWLSRIDNIKEEWERRKQDKETIQSDY